jgi:hypothetical protein
MIVKCENCTKEFNKAPSQIKRSKRNFCTQSCAASYNNKLHPKRQKRGSCNLCATPIRMSRSYCEACKIGEPWLKIRSEIEKTPRDCRHCGKTFLATKGVQCSTCCSINRRRKVKQDSLDYKGGRCEICGYDKCSTGSSSA